MKLLTQKIIKALEKAPLYSTDGVELKDKNVICKFFHPVAG